MTEGASPQGGAGEGREDGLPRLVVPHPLPRGWSPELCLLVRSLAVGAAARAARVEARALAAALDPAAWSRFADLAIERHRLAPLAAAALEGLSVPASVQARLAEAARAAAVAALRQKAETLRVVGALGEARIEPTLLKGWALAERLYGSAARRQTRDIDLMVRDADFAAAARTLERLGFVATSPVPPAGAVARPSERSAKDIEFDLPGQGFTLELHARSIAYRGWPGLDALAGGTARQAIDRTGRSVAVPSPRGDLVFLSVHGLQHVFGRLRWLHDIATLIGSRGDDALAADLAAARAIRAARFVRIAALLASAVFGSRWPASWPRPGLSERLVVRLILRAIPGEDFADPVRTAALRRVALKFLVAGTLRQRLSLLGRSGRMLVAGPAGE